MRIVVHAVDARVARAAQEQLAAAGFEAAALLGMRRQVSDGHDILIETDSEDRIAPQRADTLVRLLAAAEGTPPPVASEYFDGAIAINAPGAVLKRQISAWMRLGIELEERARRTATAVELGLARPNASSVRPLKALYIGSPNVMFLTLERALSAQGGSVTGAFSSFAGFDHLHDDVFDAVILNGAEAPQTALSLCLALRRNTALYDIPTMVITARGDVFTARAAVERGACAVIEAYAPDDAAIGWLLEAVRRERLRRCAERDLHALRDVMGDSRTGLWRPEAFAAHLARLTDDHHASGRPLSLAALRVLPAYGARRPSDMNWQRGFNEVSSLAARLCRDADCAVAMPQDVIVVALPASPIEAARRTAERIASVAACTAFVAGDHDAAPLVLEQSVAELHAGESAEGALARALRGLHICAPSSVSV